MATEKARGNDGAAADPHINFDALEDDEWVVVPSPACPNCGSPVGARGGSCRACGYAPAEGGGAGNARGGNARGSSGHMWGRAARVGFVSAWGVAIALLVIMLAS